MDDFIRGYPNLATYKSSSDNYGLYRRFGYLQSRLLLEKQDILRVLEQRLEEYDGENVASSFTRNLSDEQLRPRQALLEEIERAFNAYGESQTQPTKGRTIGTLTDAMRKPQSSNLRKSFWRPNVRQIKRIGVSGTTWRIASHYTGLNENTSFTSMTSSLSDQVEIMRGLTGVSIAHCKSCISLFLS